MKLDLLWVMGASAPLPRLDSIPTIFIVFIPQPLLVHCSIKKETSNRLSSFVFNNERIKVDERERND